MPDELIFNEISLKWFDANANRKEISPPIPVKAYIEDFSKLGQLTMRFNQGLNPSIIYKDLLEDITSVFIEPFQS